MRKIYNLFFVLLVPAILVIFTSEVMYPTGSPGGKTGSPGDGFANCTECHQGSPAVQEEFWIVGPNLVLSGYSPNETYNINVIGWKATASKFGFEATAEDSEGNKVGTFTPNPDGRTQAINNDHAITHTALGNVPLADTSTVWFFQWTAPSSYVGDVAFYVAVNTANGNGANTGDEIHLSSFVANPSNTGIDDNKALGSLNIFPNPSDGMVTIKRKTNKPEELFVFSTTGQLIYAETIDSFQKQINLSGLEKGVYFAKIGTYSERIIIR